LRLPLGGTGHEGVVGRTAPEDAGPGDSGEHDRDDRHGEQERPQAEAEAGHGWALIGRDWKI
jgi:hypothetical protein